MTRSAADIGAGLLPARPARAIRAGERIHVIGAAGAGASAAALLAHRAGASVNGCDPGGESPYSAALEEAGIALEWRHSAAHVQADGAGRLAPERVAVTKALTAIAPDHPELVAATAAGVPLEPWQQVVADAAATRGSRLVAVAGTHGKSTTSGWLVDLLVRDGRDPSAFVGALLPPALSGGPPSTARWGRDDEFVVEADEYAGNFDPYRPELALLLNAEWDHPDVFADQRAVEDAFEHWLRTAADAAPVMRAVVNIDDTGGRAVAARLAGWPGQVIEVGLDAAAGGVRGRLVAQREDGSELVLERGSAPRLRVRVGLPGTHNVANALVLAGAAAALGVTDGALAESLAEFGGVGRRLELKGEACGVTVIDDYGHHPTAIARTLEAVRQRYPGRRLWAVYEPLTFHRTAHMLERFADVLASGADRVLIADIWAGRDRDTSVTSSTELAEAVASRGAAPAEAPGSVEATADHLAGAVESGDVVLVMGGGRSYVIGQRLLELLRARPR
jgi:UDP-N-acetylmuramate--alanine ligase